MGVISVIIPCYNARRWIGETLNSVQAQDVNDLEVILVDDGSTDGAADFVETEYPFVKVVRTPNQGPSRARNLGTSLATGTFVQYLDADDLLAAEKIRRQVDALETSGADVAYGDWQELEAHPDGSFSPARIFEREFSGRAEIALFTDFWCPPAAYLFRRSVIDRVGGWNEGLPVIQDARFALDCALQGGRFIHCPGIVAYYRVRAPGSVSTRDPVAFVRDCFRNASEIERWWLEYGGIDEERCQALLKVYGYVARASYSTDRPTFELAVQSLRRLDPQYVPRHPRSLALVSRLIGYPRAEGVACLYRWLKSRTFGRGVRPGLSSE